MTITPEQLKALQLAHEAVLEAWADYKPYRNLKGFTFPLDWDTKTDNEVVAVCDALDTLTAAIENLKEGK